MRNSFDPFSRYRPGYPTQVLEVDVPHGGSKIILAADDNSNNLRVLETVLESQGYTFFGVGSGRECLALVGRIAPALFILDVEMPGMNGFDTCRQLRARADSRDVPIAFYTAHRRSADLSEGVAAGGNDFLLKPIEPGKLLARVRRWTHAPLPESLSGRPVGNLPSGAALWV